jgi:transposase InsO family protein
VLHDLRDEGMRVGQKRVARLMREQGLRGRPKRRWVRTTQSTHRYPATPNRLQRRFALADVPTMNRVWASDFTYVRTHEGWLYLAIVLDLASRRCIGWAMRNTMEADLTLSALQMALQARAPEPGLLHHSDRGVQYACDEYRALLDAYGLTASMSNKGDCWDNAVAESFFATLKLELSTRRRWRTRAEARRDIFHYIEIWYNRQRRHTTLGYLSPMAYEAKLELAA